MVSIRILRGRSGDEGKHNMQGGFLRVASSTHQSLKKLGHPPAICVPTLEWHVVASWLADRCDVATTEFPHHCSAFVEFS